MNTFTVTNTVVVLSSKTLSHGPSDLGTDMVAKLLGPAQLLPQANEGDCLSSLAVQGIGQTQV